MNQTSPTITPSDYQFNLSDFALFLFVMKNKRAYQCALSIFMDEPDIKIQEVKVEQCLEVEGLQLEAGTKKIFLNMTSKNGSQELVSLLQYMKETRIDNPNITVHDSRILELDNIVTEVKESEEWEAVTMNFMEFCMEHGMKQGMEKGMKKGEYLNFLSLIRKKHSKGLSISDIADTLEESEEYIQKFLDQITKHPDWTDEQIVDDIIDHEKK